MRRSERLVEMLFVAAAGLSVGLTLLILGFMVALGLPLFEGTRFFNLLWLPWDPNQGIYGIYPMVIGTMSIAGLALTASFPLSLGCAALISVLAPRGFGRLLKRFVQFMTGIPTVIYGFVGIFLLVPFIREVFQSGSGMCILSAALLLAVLIAPTMILFFVGSFENVPREYLNAVDALGGSRVQKFLFVMLPCAWRGILTGVVLALGRAVGDTLISLMIAGNAVAVPASLLDSARTLTAHIALIIAADFDSLEFKTLFACGVTLYVFTTLLVLGVRALGAIGRKAP